MRFFSKLCTKNYFVHVLLAIGLFGLSPKASAQKDAKAKTILDKSSEACSGAKDLTVGFTLEIKDPATAVNERFDGEILLKGNRFFLSTPESVTWFDGKTQWVYLKSAQEVTVSEPNEVELRAINPLAVLNSYKTDCNYKFLSEKTDTKNRKVYEIELIPPRKSEFSRILLQINRTDYIPVFFQLFYKNKTENRIYVTKYQLNQNHPDSLFVFDKKCYPEAEIIDLR